MKKVEDMTDEEVLAEYIRLMQQKQKRKGYFGTNERKERIAKDPRAYFTRPTDFERAERKTEGATADVPKFNSFGRLVNRPLQKYDIVVVSILNKELPLIELKEVAIDGEPTYDKLPLDETRIPVESIVYVMDNHYSLWKFETI